MNALAAAPDSVAIKARARELGLDVCGITTADPARQAVLGFVVADPAASCTPRRARGSATASPCTPSCSDACGGA